MAKIYVYVFNYLTFLGLIYKSFHKFTLWAFVACYCYHKNVMTLPSSALDLAAIFHRTRLQAFPINSLMLFIIYSQRRFSLCVQQTIYRRKHCVNVELIF